MVTKIQKWGNSQGLRLAKGLLEDAHISVGDDVDVTARDGLIVIAPARRIRGTELKELVSRMPRTARPKK
jgi:antitoxin MazE